jgi:transglutaminase/protease-like cytokinesis protein 3
MDLRILITSVSLAFSAVVAVAQPSKGRDFTKVDEYVKKLGSLDTLTQGTISETVTKSFPDRIDKIRAIYDWIAYNISYDLKAAKAGFDIDKVSSADVLLKRKASPLGYTTLFQDMCSSANIRCLTVDGFIKTNTDEIGDPDQEINHSWAVVQLGQSPEEWYYFDPAWASGYTDADMKTFTRNYSDIYFFADKAIFNLQHYPDNEAWKLGEAPKNKNGFFNQPIINIGAYTFNLKKFTPAIGKVQVSAEHAAAFSFNIDANTSVEKVELKIGKIKKVQIKEVPFNYSKGTLNISYKFTEGDYPVTVLVNGKELITYHVDVE